MGEIRAYGPVFRKPGRDDLREFMVHTEPGSDVRYLDHALRDRRYAKVGPRSHIVILGLVPRTFHTSLNLH